MIKKLYNGTNLKRKQIKVLEMVLFKAHWAKDETTKSFKRKSKEMMLVDIYEWMKKNKISNSKNVISFIQKHGLKQEYNLTVVKKDDKFNIEIIVK